MNALVHLHRAAIARAEVDAPERIPPARRAPAATRPARRTPTVARTMDRRPPVLPESASLWTAWDLLHSTGAHHLVVVDDHERPVGVLDDRTIALEWPPGPMGAHRLPLHSLIRGRDRDRAEPRVHASRDLRVAARVLLGSGTDAVPVVDDTGRLVGLVTLRHFAQLAAGGDEDPAAIGAANGTSDRG
jgi:CBS domain-containing protein